jgi:hypothetical protein
LCIQTNAVRDLAARRGEAGDAGGRFGLLRPLGGILAAALFLFLAGCAETPPYVYHYIPGRTAVLRDGIAIPPPSAPEPVLLAIAAGNRIAGSPYEYGAGHGNGDGPGSAFDCSGAASYLLRAAGRLREPIPSRAFRNYGDSGYGRWISIYARTDHVFLVVAGLRYDTGWSGNGSKGPQWTTHGRPATGSVVRHPPGL